MCPCDYNHCKYSEQFRIYPKAAVRLKPNLCGYWANGKELCHNDIQKYLKWPGSSMGKVSDWDIEGRRFKTPSPGSTNTKQKHTLWPPTWWGQRHEVWFIWINKVFTLLSSLHYRILPLLLIYQPVELHRIVTVWAARGRCVWVKHDSHYNGTFKAFSNSYIPLTASL